MPPFQRSIVTLVVMGATLIVILDTTIANVALPHMKAALSATQDSISWVLTSYIVASAIATPITGWLTDRIGRRQLFTFAIVGFTLSSMLCGVSVSLGMMVLARLLQGLFGACIVPLSQAIIYEINPQERHARAMGVWSMGMMLGPLLGPVAGGWLTDTWSWRWCFFINVPIGAVTAAGSWLMLPNNLRRRRRFDRFGFALLAIALLAMQLVLDRGTDRDWFQSTEIQIEAAVMVAALWMFIVHVCTARGAIVPAALFRNRTYVSALVLITVIGGLVTAGSALLAPMLQGIMGYPVMTAGILVMPRGVGLIITLQLASRLIGKVDPRILMGAGLVLAAVSLYMMTDLSPDMGSRVIIVSGFIQGLGMGLVSMPLNLLAFSSVEPPLQTEGASFYSLMRGLGGSITISVTSAMLSHNIQQSHADLSAGVDPTVQHVLAMGQIQNIGQIGGMIPSFLDVMINQQATFIAYIDDYWAMMWSVIFVLPLVLILRPVKRRGDMAAIDMGH
ncbi:MAG: DHA2 family efflux MFS transporter permease subunit [Sphingomonadaceae bacterium]|nr:DHA2 family efflux MFS transporter permease subunit [Sphingomonadaceae bacterium]